MFSYIRTKFVIRREFMKASIITVVYNGRDYIESAIQSVLRQTYKNIEYLIIDGGSTDGTVDIIKRYRDQISKFISEKDDGLYDAMNKGIKMATGDIIGTLNSDDFYADNSVIERVVEAIEREQADVLWGDLVYVKAGNESKTTRVWKSSVYEPGKFQKGWMPPHPTFFVRKSVYDRFGLFRTDFKIAADYELMLRFLEKNKIKGVYLPVVLVKMRTGGKTGKGVFNIKNIIRYKLEDYRAWKINDLDVGLSIFFTKSFSKINQYFTRW